MRTLILSFLLLHPLFAAEIYTGFDTVVPEIWNPAHGYFLKNTNILHNARINGCYGSKRIPGVRPEWRQSTFESYRDGEYLRQIENGLSYPLEPMAAFIQWCYPSPSRTSLGANVNCHDPLGIWVRDVTSADVSVKQPALALMGNMIRLIDEIYKEAAPDKTIFTPHFRALFNPVEVPLKRIDAFTDIVFEAITAERFDPDFKELYPVGMVRRTLLAYITDIITNHADMVTIFQNAGMIPADYVAVPIPPLSKAIYTDCKSRLEIALDTVTTSDFVNFLMGEKIYGNILPALINTKRSVFTIGEHKFQFANCGEVSVLNLFIIATWGQGTIHPEYLDHLLEYPMIQRIKAHFTTYNTLALLDTPESHNDWGLLLSNLNDPEDTRPLQQIKYIRRGMAEIMGGTPSVLNLFDVIFSRPGAGAASPKESRTFIRGWETADLSSAADKELVLEKWRLIFSLLNHPLRESIIALDTANTKKIGIDSIIEFKVNDTLKLSYYLGKGHSHMHQSYENTYRNLPYFPSCDPILKECYENHQSNSFLFGNFKIEDRFTSYGNKLHEYILEDSPLGNFSRAVLFRLMTSYAYNRMDDDHVGVSVINILGEYKKHTTELDLVPWVFSSPMGEDFMLQHYLPNALYPGNVFGDTAIAYLKHHNRYVAFVDQLMNSNHPRKLQFAAFYGLDKIFRRLYLNYKSPEATAMAKAVFEGSVEHDHPLLHAITVGHLDVVKSITQNGKSPHWKADPSSDIRERKIIHVLDETTSCDVIRFIAMHDPNLFKLAPDFEMPLQIFLTAVATPEIFEFLRGHLSLSIADLLSWRYPFGDEESLSSLDAAVCYPNHINNYSVAHHILDTYPEIPVTKQTLESFVDGFWFVPKDTAIVDVAHILLSRYAGDLTSLLPIFCNYNMSNAWFIDLIAERLPKDMLIEGKSPYLLDQDYYGKIRKIWLFAHHNFSWDIVDESGKTVLEELRSHHQLKTIRWMFGKVIEGESKPDDAEILKCKSDWESARYYGTFGLDLDVVLLKERFDNDIMALRKRLGYIAE